MWIGHRRQAAAAARPDSALLSLAQTLGVARQRRITAAVALALDLMEQAAIVPTAGVPALQNDRLPAIEPAPAGITALPALGKCLVPRVTDDGTARVPGRSARCRRCGPYEMPSHRRPGPWCWGNPAGAPQGSPAAACCAMPGPRLSGARGKPPRATVVRRLPSRSVRRAQ